MRFGLLAAFLLAAPVAAAQPVAGVVGAVLGSATLIYPGAAGTPVATGLELREGAVLRTGPDSRLRLDLADGSTLFLGARASLRIDHLAAAGTRRPTHFTHLLGFLRTLVAAQASPGRFEIETDSVVAAVRGTDWIQNSTPGQTEVFVEAGRVMLRGRGGPVTLAAGEGDTFRARLAHTQVTRWAPPKIAAFEAATRLP